MEVELHIVLVAACSDPPRTSPAGGFITIINCIAGLNVDLTQCYCYLIQNTGIFILNLYSIPDNIPTPTLIANFRMT